MNTMRHANGIDSKLYSKFTRCSHFIRHCFCFETHANLLEINSSKVSEACFQLPLSSFGCGTFYSQKCLLTCLREYQVYIREGRSVSEVHAYIYAYGDSLTKLFNGCYCLTSIIRDYIPSLDIHPNTQLRFIGKITNRTILLRKLKRILEFTKHRAEQTKRNFISLERLNHNIEN